MEDVGMPQKKHKPEEIVTCSPDCPRSEVKSVPGLIRTPTLDHRCPEFCRFAQGDGLVTLLDDDPRFSQAVEDLAVEQLVFQLRVEALAVSVLPR
jgi:hypothetical protein